MKLRRVFSRAVLWFLVLVMALPPWVFARDAEAQSAALSREQIEQAVAPIALYPDSLIAQILMASTYPLEIVAADRWAKQNKNLKGDALAQALEKQDWDPSVKSLVNFPQVLDMMSQKLDWTQKLGDAFLADQKSVLDSIQMLRHKAQAAGNLKSTNEQKVVVEKETIIIEPASPQVVYVPTYNPTVVYGPWPYPAYPPYYYYPPGYVAGAALVGFGVGLAVGAAWGHAWGGCNWHGGEVNVNVNRNANLNQNINRGQYQQRYQSGQGKFQHDASHRKGVAYRDSATAKQFGQSSGRTAQTSREARGFSDSRGGAGGQTRDMSKGASSMDRAGGRDSAFSGAGSGGFEKKASDRGQMSRASSGADRSSLSKGGGGSRGGGGGARGGGGGGRGGGGRR